MGKEIFDKYGSPSAVSREYLFYLRSDDYDSVFPLFPLMRIL
jgi:hypothetical protein